MRTHMIQRMLLASGLLGLTGCCGICGQWESTGVRPVDAVKQFNIGTATFNCDGTYEAVMKYDGQERKSKGTYTYKWDKLTLKPESGEMREYEAKLNLFHKKLDVEYDRENQPDIHVDMKRLGCPKDCCKSCCKKA